MRIFIRGYYGKYNTGDELMLYAIINDLKKKLPDCEIEVFGIDNETSENLTVKPVYSRKQSIAKSDLLIIGGGNLLYDSNFHGHNSLKECLREIIYAKIHRTKVIFYGVGVGPLVSKIGKILIKFIIRLSEGITVRDHYSYSLLIKCGVDKKKITLGSDIVFNVPFFDPPFTSNEFIINSFLSKIEKRKIIVNVFNLHRELLPWNVNKHGKFRRELIAEMLDRLIKDFDVQIIFVAAQGQIDGCDHLEANRIIDLMRNSNNCINLPYLNPIWLPSIIKNADLVITMRLHIAILAYKLGILPISLSYSEKIRSFYEMISLKKYCFDIQKINFDSLYNVVSMLLKNINDFKYKYQESINNLHELSQEHTRRLGEIIDKICFEKGYKVLKKNK